MGNMGNIRKPLLVIQECLVEMGLPYDVFDVDEENQKVSLEYAGDNGEWKIAIVVYEEDEEIMAVSIMPELVPYDRRRIVSEFIGRVNFGFTIGGFDIDYDDGEVRFKAGLSIPSTGLTIEMVQPLIMSGIVNADEHFFTTFQEVMAGEKTPAQAAGDE